MRSQKKQARRCTIPGSDNSCLDAKVDLRYGHLPDGDITVLDAFGGFGVVWQAVASKCPSKKILRVGIDKEPRPNCVQGDNRKLMKGLTLSNFSVIDLDAYGCPYDQLQILFDRKYKGTVFFTMIQTGLRTVPLKLLEVNGISKDMYKQCPTLFGKIGWQLMKEWLAENGVTTLWHRSASMPGSDKHYCCFIL